MEATQPSIERERSNSLAARRRRNKCIAISSIHSNNNEPKLPEDLSLLSLVDKSISNDALSAPETVKYRSKSVSNGGNNSQESGIAKLSSTKTALTLQRSVSLQEFDDVALPADVEGSPTTRPITPNYTTLKHSHVMTRRSSSIQQGQVFTSDDFVLGATLGTGFFGKAIKATHKVTGDVMVIKELVTCDEEAQKTFLKESAVLRALSHPKLLRYIGFLYTKAKDLHIVTEYIPGGTLEDLLTETEPLPYIRKLTITIDISSAMDYLHSQKIIHRDLTSSNCFIKADGSVVVADFGLSKLILDTNVSLEEKRNSGTSPSYPHKLKKKKYTLVGSPYWMAPEMLRREQYDESIDIFSFGIIMCEVIGQVKADPDYLPRLNNFALDENTFIEKFCQNCPQPFYIHAFKCCHIVPNERPPFGKSFQDLLELYKSHTAAERRASRLLAKSKLAHSLSYQSDEV